MRLDDEEGSSNIEDRRGQSGGLGFGGRGMSLGTFAIVAVIALAFGINPMTILGGGPLAPSNQQIGQPQQPADPARPASEADSFVAKVLRTTERSWETIFANEISQPYQPPRLVLFAGNVQSGCGAAQSAMGPFYCPADSKIYLDQSFFDELSRRFGAPGDFAAAYVIAHEVGHHVQNLLGISGEAQAAQQRASETRANAISVQVELQADCLAGVWAKDNARRLEPGDVAEAMRAAAAIGDDTLQRAAQGVVVPESFTHGSSAQRTKWFMRGMTLGTVAGCDTFSAGAP
ncbi:MAG: neutral zinc metallopeptidase [Polymorphobacter sp.]